MKICIIDFFILYFIYCSMKCADKSCYRTANFIGRYKSDAYCMLHKSDDMININKRSCHTEGCNRIAIYGNHGSDLIRCFRHKEAYMTNLYNTVCAEHSCRAPAAYGSRKSLSLYCIDHKYTMMERVAVSQCIMPDCGADSLESRTYCERHKPIDIKMSAPKHQADSGKTSTCDVTSRIRRDREILYREMFDVFVKNFDSMPELLKSNSSIPEILNQEYVFVCNYRYIVVEGDLFQQPVLGTKNSRFNRIADAVSPYQIIFLRINYGKCRNSPFSLDSRREKHDALIKAIHTISTSILPYKRSFVCMYYDQFDGAISYNQLSL